MKCFKCGVEFYNLDGSDRKECWSCTNGIKEESQPRILREGERMKLNNAQTKKPEVGA